MSDRFGMTGNFLVHSAKGTSWEKSEHKYIKKIIKDGKTLYIYGKDGSNSNINLDNLSNNDDYYISDYYERELDEAIRTGDSKKFYSLLKDYKSYSNFAKTNNVKPKDVPSNFIRFDGVNNTKTVDEYIKKYNNEQNRKKEAIKKVEEEAKLRKKGSVSRISAIKLQTSGKNGAPSNIIDQTKYSLNEYRKANKK